VRVNHAVENFVLLRRIAFNLLSKEDSNNSIRGKHKIAGWNDDFLVRVLGGYDAIALHLRSPFGRIPAHWIETQVVILTLLAPKRIDAN
jgi:hypothetical protein